MKKQLSFALLTLSILITNILPGQATTRIVSSNTESDLLQNEETIVNDNDNEWCAELPWMGLLCWAF